MSGCVDDVWCKTGTNQTSEGDKERQEEHLFAKRRGQKGLTGEATRFGKLLKFIQEDCTFLTILYFHC